ncbi:MAG: HNH endonuclease [Roseibium sp.]|uniref:HNH endonuclease n=1 Tax=Roseibium sp. TaxID=1936156 RepID=UPI0032988B65
METLIDRKSFKAKVFERDGHRCVICGDPAVDAHHILERKLFSDGGYYLSNGSSLCSDCHMAAETTEFTVERIRSACGIDKPALPEGFASDRSYDKWGNEVLADLRRRPGPLFDDPGMRKALARILYDGTFIKNWS